MGSSILPQLKKYLQKSNITRNISATMANT